MSATEAAASGQPSILVIDDNQADLDLFNEALAEAGERIACRTAKSVDQGISLLEAGRRPGAVLPSLIVLDLCMPGHDGRQLLRHLGAAPDLQRIPVVVLSSSNWHRDRDECLALGATHYRVKPLDWVSYLELIAYLRGFWSPAPRKVTDGG